MSHFEGVGLQVNFGVLAGGGAYAAGDTLGTLQKLSSIVPDSAGALKLTSALLLDTAKQAKGLTLFFFDKAVAIPADNAAFDVSAADAIHCVGIFTFADADYISMVSRSFAQKGNIKLLMQAAKPAVQSIGSQGKDLWVAAMTSGAPTYTDGALRAVLGLEKAR